MDSEDHDLHDLLDSALNDFKLADGNGIKVDGRSTTSQPDAIPASSSERGEASGGATSAVQGLGQGLPSLNPARRRKPSKSVSVSSSSTPGERKGGTSAEERMKNTLEQLANQTKSTVESMDDGTIDDETVENLVKQFEEMGSSQDMQTLMDTMMRQLLSKDVLHEPMKEIGERYPAWLEANRHKLSPEDLSRYIRQEKYIGELCHVFEHNPEDFQKIVDLMQHMQECGQPPADIVRDLTPGLELGQDGLPMLPDMGGQGGLPPNCNIM